MPTTQPPHQSPFIESISLATERVPGFDRYPYNLPAVTGLARLGTLPLHPCITFFVGENGSGKSTLLEAMAVYLELNAEGGSKNFKFATRETHSPLHESLRMMFNRGRRARDTFFLRAESFYNVATDIEKQPVTAHDRQSIVRSYGAIPLHEQSHGEAFLTMFTKRFGADGLYLLDEPEAALSPTRQMSLLTQLHDLTTIGLSQLIIATHSPIVMAYPNAWIYSFSQSGISRIEYRQTEHFKVTKQFLDRPERMLDVLLEPPADDERE
jgi:predicted ATPase